MAKGSGSAREVVETLTRRVAERLSLELDRVDVSTHRKQSFIRVYVDKEGGVTLEDCTRMSRELGTVLDVEDPMPGPYTLEVSSPGLDRPLLTRQDYERFSGRLVRLRTYAPVEGVKHFRGRLVGLVEDQIRIEDQETGRIHEVPWDAVAKARLEVEI